MRTPRKEFIPCKGSNQPSWDGMGACQVCGRSFVLSVSGYVPRHRAETSKADA